MERLYPAKALVPSRNRWLLLIIFVVAVWAWLLYTLVAGSPRWEKRLLIAVVVSSVAAISVSQSFWPILSFDKNVLYHHRPLWFAKKHLVANLNNFELSDSNLYLTYKSGSVSAIDLARISPENMSKIAGIVSELKNAG